MQPGTVPQLQPTPLILSNRDEDILKAASTYHFFTAKDICYLLYSPNSLTHVRERCAALSGNNDHELGYHLYRFAFPTAKPGNRERIYTLSATGREILDNLGISVDWHFRPAKLRTFSHSHLLHSLSITRTIIAFHVWSRTKPHIRVESSLSYELAKNPPVVSIPAQGKMAKVPVIPDGLIVLNNMRSNERVVIIWEVDHNTESQPRFKAHVTARRAYVQSASFKKVYGNILFRIAYVTFGQTPSASEARRVSLCTFTRKY